MSKLELTVLKNYRVDIVHLTPYRDRYTIVELDDNGNPTGRSWWEPFNSRSGNPDELVARFNRRIAGDNAPVPEDYNELSLFANALANVEVAGNKNMVVSAVRRCLNELMEQTIEMCDLLASHKEASPKQVILEASMDKLTRRILDIFRRAIYKAAREAAEQTQHPYETIRSTSEKIEQATDSLTEGTTVVLKMQQETLTTGLGSMRKAAETLQESVKPVGDFFAGYKQLAEQHYRLTRWKRLKTVFARDKDATG